MKDNFNKIQKLLLKIIKLHNLNTKDIYFHLQILIRSKDVHEGSNNRLVKSYSIDSIFALEKYKKEIITLCELYKARAYINIAPKSKKYTALEMLESLTKCFKKNEYDNLRNLWQSAMGSVKPIEKYWIVDCDNISLKDIKSIIRYINIECLPKQFKFITLIPTKNGIHIITRPFDTYTFNKKYPTIDVHKNNPTVLYIPKSLDYEKI